MDPYLTKEQQETSDARRLVYGPTKYAERGQEIQLEEKVVGVMIGVMFWQLVAGDVIRLIPATTP